MSAHLYNLGADMNISTGVDRLGKVVFWVLSSAAAVAAALLLIGNTPSNLSETFAATVALGFIVGYLVMDHGDAVKFTLGACLLLAYSILMGVFAVNKVHDADPYSHSAFSLALAGVFFVSYLLVKKITGYIYRGFATK